MDNDSNSTNITTNWQSQQVAGILIIIFFGIISIVYVFFMNTYIIREKENILDSKYKLPFLLFTLISSITIITIVASNSNEYSKIIIPIIVLLNILIIFAKIIYEFFKTSNFDVISFTNSITTKINEIESIKYISKFFEYGGDDCNDSICNYLSFYNYSLIAPFIIFLFLYFSIKTSDTIMYAIYAIILFIEYAFKGRYNIFKKFYNEKQISLIIYFFSFLVFNLLLYLA
uniref:Uncharacterized protein n=1 Tax=viral metagenome TaxID=1070528 RepID=A0A6C0HZ49_9ZZZZ